MILPVVEDLAVILIGDREWPCRWLLGLRYP